VFDYLDFNYCTHEFPNYIKNRQFSNIRKFRKILEILEILENFGKFGKFWKIWEFLENLENLRKFEKWIFLKYALQPSEIIRLQKKTMSKKLLSRKRMNTMI
jgi:hypothetical protein